MGAEKKGGGAYMNLPDDSFSFGAYNSLADWGIRAVKYDVLTPAKRPRKVQIPMRSGMYDFGALCWEERTVRIECTLERKISRGELREIAGALSRKSQLRLWDEPDKYYLGELYDPAEILDYYDEAMRDFTLSFVCEPFAFGPVTTVPLTMGANPVAYRGTAPAPCLIVLRNLSREAAQTVTITAVKRSV